MTSVDGLCNSADLMIDGKKVEEAESPSIDKLKVHASMAAFSRRRYRNSRRRHGSTWTTCSAQRTESSNSS